MTNPALLRNPSNIERPSCHDSYTVTVSCHLMAITGLGTAPFLR
ncbi:hypothetical protein AVEN_53109-1, partial [Araneus ventricosus]